MGFYNAYAKFIRTYINKPKNIGQMHSVLISSHNDFKAMHDNNSVVYDNKTYSILRFKTPVFGEGDNLYSYIVNEILPSTQDNDIITIAESVVAITQGNAFRLDDVRIGKWALILYPWVSNVTYGTGLGMAQTMQCAIDTAGLCTILKATLMGALDRISGRHGSFYAIAGNAVKSIDFKKEHPVPFRGSHNYIVLSPSQPNAFCRRLYKYTRRPCAVMDVNNVSVDILGYYPESPKLKDLLLHAMKGNPAGQEGEKTSIVVLRQT